MKARCDAHAGEGQKFLAFFSRRAGSTGGAKKGAVTQKKQHDHQQSHDQKHLGGITMALDSGYLGLGWNRLAFNMS